MSFINRTILTLVSFALIVTFSFNILARARDDRAQPLGVNTWTSGGPGSVVGLAIDPTNSNVIYAAAYDAGVYKTSNNGGSWTQINNGLPTSFPGDRAVIVDPSNSSTVYAGANDGVYKTSNGGANWSKFSTGLSSSPGVNAFAIDPTNTQIVYAATFNNGMYKTTNGGGNWSAINNGLNPTNGLPFVQCSSLVIDPTNTQILYVGTSSGAFKTTNAGANWSAVNSGLSNIGGVSGLTIAATNTQVLYACNNGVYKTIDGGASWNKLSNLSSSDGRPFFQAVVVDPTNAQTAYALAESTGVYRTTDGGNFWATVNDGLPKLSFSTLVIDRSGKQLHAGAQASVLGSGNVYDIQFAQPSIIQFSAANAAVSEGAGFVALNLTRTGDASLPVTVDYETFDNTASERKDYITTLGTLFFNAGETSKTINILVIDGVYVDGDRTLNLILQNPTNGAMLGTPNTVTLTIQDNDTTAGAPNPVDATRFFVNEQYIDFFTRLPDDSGRAFWENQLNSLLANCTNVSPPSEKNKCILSQRAQVSAAFFLSIEFQETGYYVIRFYQESFNRLPTLREFLRGAQEVGRGVVVGAPGYEQLLAQNKLNFAQNWTQRADFKSRYDALSNSAYINALFTNGGAGANDETALRMQLQDGLNFGTETRATVLQKVGDSKTVFNAQYNKAFVLLQYFGYLRRNPQDSPDTDLSGYNFWLNKMNQFTPAGDDAQQPGGGLTRVRRAQMIEAFIDSTEYRRRFAPQ